MIRYLVLIFMIFLINGIWAADEITVTGFGKGQDYDSSLMQAIKDAVNKTGFQISYETVSRNFQIVHDTIVVQSTGTKISDLQVLEKKAEGGIWQTKIKCNIHRDRIYTSFYEQLQDNLKNAELTIETEIPEESMDKEALQYAGEKIKKEIIQQGKNIGFSFIEKAFNLQASHISSQIPVAKGSFIDFLLDHPAELTIRIKAESFPMHAWLPDVESARRLRITFSVYNTGGYLYADGEKEYDFCIYRGQKIQNFGDNACNISQAIAQSLFFQLSRDIERKIPNLYTLYFHGFEESEQTRIREILSQMPKFHTKKFHEAYDFLRVIVYYEGTTPALLLSEALQQEKLTYIREEHGCWLSFYKKE